MHPDVSLLEARRKLWIVGDSRDNKKSKKIPIGRATGDRNPVRVTALLGDVLLYSRNRVLESGQVARGLSR